MATTRPAELNSGIWTSWLPVTTAWTSQSVCNSAAWARFGIKVSGGYWPYIYDPAYAQSVADSLTCLPPEATQWWDGHTTIANTITSWSIGPIVCPAAYTTASTLVVSTSSISVICCPTNFNFVRHLLGNGGIDGICTSPMTSGQILTYASSATNSYVPTTTTLSDPLPLLAVPVEGYNFVASTNIPSTTVPSSTASYLATSQSTATSTEPPTDTSAPQSGLTQGAKTGIGVGVGVGSFALILIVVAAIFLLRRRRRQKEDVTYAPATSELPSFWEYKGGNPVHANNGPQEIDGYSRPAELQG